MPFLKVLLLLLVIALGSGCAERTTSVLRTRGMHGEQLAATGQPAVSMQAKLPLHLSFRNSPFIYTQHNFASPNIWGALYSHPSGSPAAFVLLAQAPQGWEWDLTRMPLSVGPGALTDTMFDNQPFVSYTLYIPFENDPFTPLFTVSGQGEGAPLHWRARRFERLMQNKTVKLVMEYREAVPLAHTEFASPEERAAFEKAASDMFVVAFSGVPGDLSTPEWNTFGARDDFKRLVGNLLMIERLREVR